MRLVPLLAGAVLVFASAAAAAADICPSVAKERWLSKEAIAAKARELGYQVRIVQEEHGCWEVKGLDAKGARVEVYFHPATAEVVKVKG
ncbi:MAG: PepSY domain-containing protein [Geminicoccaceae bacterium]|nr:PepSY domain-containing protein [Geminicoccaceae bacterium]MCX8100341.1 PepSY domain-containing protein [Geminicoccaceae bacterium]MDW8368713.1 PepSY domain-containing protein [Geminicoccaceae bacterium]